MWKRETKLGLVVSGSFLCLLGAMVGKKLLYPERPNAPTGSDQVVAQAPVTPGATKPEGNEPPLSTPGKFPISPANPDVQVIQPVHSTGTKPGPVVPDFAPSLPPFVMPGSPSAEEGNPNFPKLPEAPLLAIPKNSPGVNDSNFTEGMLADQANKAKMGQFSGTQPPSPPNTFPGPKTKFPLLPSGNKPDFGHQGFPKAPPFPPSPGDIAMTSLPQSPPGLPPASVPTAPVVPVQQPKKPASPPVPPVPNGGSGLPDLPPFPTPEGNKSTPGSIPDLPPIAPGGFGNTLPPSPPIPGVKDNIPFPPGVPGGKDNIPLPPTAPGVKEKIPLPPPAPPENLKPEGPTLPFGPPGIPMPPAGKPTDNKPAIEIPGPSALIPSQPPGGAPTIPVVGSGKAVQMEKPIPFNSGLDKGPPMPPGSPSVPVKIVDFNSKTPPMPPVEVPNFHEQQPQPGGKKPAFAPSFPTYPPGGNEGNYNLKPAPDKMVKITETPGKSEPVVTEDFVEAYKCQADTPNFQAISKKFYLHEKYAQALFLYNHNHPNGSSWLKQNPPVLKLGETIYIPPFIRLQTQYGSVIPKSHPIAETPSYSAKPPVEVKSPTPVEIPYSPTPPVAPPIKVGSAPAPSAGVIQQTATGPVYVVQGEPEMIYQIALKTLGDGKKWNEIWRLNQQLDTRYPVQVGTQIRLPASGPAKN